MVSLNAMCAQLTAPDMTSWQRWIARPQRLWIRRAIFQIHLWVGLGIGLYIVAISVSGSALVFLPQIRRNFSRRTVVVTASGPRMSVDELAQHAQRVYPTYEVDNIREGQAPGEPDEVVLERAHKRIDRLFDPYTGLDLGNRYSVAQQIFTWLTGLHDVLLGGRTGGFVNGIGSCLLTLLALTGAVIWWPGIKNWRRSTTISWKGRFPRLNWDLHSAMGFWCWLFVLVWGISGIYFCFPALSFSPGIHVMAGSFLPLLTELHFGRFNWFTEVLWTIIGLVPAASAVTGALMWWNRVLRKKFRRPYRHSQPAPASDHLLIARE
jgi:uncharacterized iron-regulated membrane protein